MDESIPVRRDHHGTNVDEAIAFYEQVHSSQDLHVGRATRDGFSWRYRLVGDNDLLVGTSAVAATRWGTIGQGQHYVLAWATSPGITLDPDSRDAIEMAPHVPVLYPARDFSVAALPSTQHFIRFDTTFLESVAAATHGTIPAALQFRSTTTNEAVAQLRAVIASAAPELLQTGVSADERRRLNMLVADATIEAFRIVPASEVAVNAGPRSLRFAQEWMIAHAREPITSIDVSRATGIAARSLQAAFQRHTNATPMEFLRQVRLHRSRADLVRSTPSDSTVAAIAQAWGFQHLGRFSKYYADAFGELPSETLRAPTTRRR
ncbi:AraC family transcriptional regulator [Curtobacterium sp. TXMA1]|uniref:AraC family transcriptional regulator n=1 Tax=Curtobacterium sp. TXMA1 TaxID=2876939 RepID=UPI001CCE32D5|nr:AraC family transcriptional regulator [Curtobacterium sp. TXMA1]UBQ02567.1 helix-turn-helix domain-containing protein [Curtobacterium sp. TXMA1]